MRTLLVIVSSLAFAVVPAVSASATFQPPDTRCTEANYLPVCAQGRTVCYSIDGNWVCYDIGGDIAHTTP